MITATQPQKDIRKSCKSDSFVGFGVGIEGDMVTIETDSKIPPHLALNMAVELIKAARQTMLQNEHKLREASRRANLPLLSDTGSEP
jgi:hypothetical protein